MHWICGLVWVGVGIHHTTLAADKGKGRRVGTGGALHDTAATSNKAVAAVVWHCGCDRRGAATYEQ